MHESVANPEQNQLAKLYLEDIFKDYVKEKYLIENSEVF